MHIKNFRALAFVATLFACASPQTARPTLDSGRVAEEQQRQSLFVLENRAAEYKRVYDIAARLSAANAELCARRSNTIGIRLENISDYGRDFREAARTLWQLDDTPAIQWLEDGAPASVAGLRVGDRIVSINGRAVSPSRRASREAIDAIRDAAQTGNVRITIRRGAETIATDVTPRSDCGYDIQMFDDDTLNAAADGRTIYVTRGMLRFVRTDEELALILGHELAHNAMRHIEAQQQNAMMGTAAGLALDVLAAAAGVNTGGAFTDAASGAARMMFSQEFESEADYVGLYFMARAGYSIDGAEAFWRRMAAENPRGIRLAYTHPNTAERFVGIAAAREEIALKMAEGEALTPNMRGSARASTSESAEAYGSGPDVVSFSDTVTVAYRCTNNRVLRVQFEQSEATIHETRRPRIRLRRVPAESGFRYEDGSAYTLMGTTASVELQSRSSEPVRCARRAY